MKYNYLIRIVFINKRQRTRKGQPRTDNAQKPVRKGTQDEGNKRKTQTKNGQCTEPGNKGHTRRRKTKQNHKPRTDNPQNPETKGTQDEEKKTQTKNGQSTEPGNKGHTR